MYNLISSDICTHTCEIIIPIKIINISITLKSPVRKKKKVQSELFIKIKLGKYEQSDFPYDKQQKKFLISTE